MWVRVEAGQVAAASWNDPGKGWVPVTDTPRPADTPTTTWDQGVAVIDSTPAVTWTQRPKTAAELAAETPEVKAELLAQANAAVLRQRAATALATNTAFMAIANPTTAQAVAQVKALTQQTTALIRLALGALDSTT